MSPAPAPFAPIKKLSLAETVYDRLLMSIISGELTVGERLNVDELCSGFGVSRTPVREALARLEREKLIEVSRNAATTVASWNVLDMQFRAQVLSGIARSTALDPSQGRPTLNARGPVTLETFVHVCIALAEPLRNSLAQRTVTELAEPLRLFLQPVTLRAHGIDPNPIRLERAITFLVEAVDDGDRALIAAAIDDLTDAFIDCLDTTSD